MNIPPAEMTRAHETCQRLAGRWASQQPVWFDRAVVPGVAWEQVERAALRWDAGKGARFSNFAWLTVLGALRHEYRNQFPGGRNAYDRTRAGQNVPQTISLDAYVDTQDGEVRRDVADPHRFEGHTDAKVLGRWLFSHLDVRQRRIVAWRLAGWPPRMIARRLGVSKNTVWRWERQAWEVMREAAGVALAAGHGEGGG